MEIYLPAIIMFAVVTLIGGRVWWSAPHSRARRALRRMENIPIASIKHGEWAKITGIVGAVAPQMRSPIGERECIGFWLEVERTDRNYSVVLQKDACGGFSIADETGNVSIDGPFLLGLDTEQDWSYVPADRYGALEEAGVATEGPLWRRRFAFREALLQPGDRVTVLGLVFFEPDPASPSIGVRSPQLVPRMRGAPGKPVVVADAGGRVSR